MFYKKLSSSLGVDLYKVMLLGSVYTWLKVLSLCG